MRIHEYRTNRVEPRLRDALNMIRSTIEKIEYKDWEVFLNYRGHDSWMLEFGLTNIQVVDADKSDYSKQMVGPPIKLTFSEGSCFFLYAVTAEEVVERIWRLVTEFNYHEQKEWFKFNGRHYRDPHPDHRTPGDGKEFRVPLPPKS